jgi:hypothetical protein
VFTARYALSPYIKQISFVFKGLNNVTLSWEVLRTVTDMSVKPIHQSARHRILEESDLNAHRNENLTSQYFKLSFSACRLMCFLINE